MLVGSFFINQIFIKIDFRMYATLQLNGERRRKGSSTNLNDFQVGDSSSVIFFSSEKSSWLWIDRQTKLIFINFLGARKFRWLGGFWMLINWFILQERSTEQCHYPGCPEVSSCWGAQVSLNSGIAGSNAITEIYLLEILTFCHSSRLSSLLFFEIVFVIVLRVNFSGVKEDKCGEEISTVKLTTCRSPLRRIKNNSEDSVR